MPEEQKVTVKSKDLILEIHLNLKTANNKKVVAVEHNIPLTAILEPMFIKDGAKKIEQIVNMLGVEVFNTMVRDFFLNKVEDMHKTQNFIEHKTLIDTIQDNQSIIEINNADGSKEQKVLVKPVISEETNLIVELEETTNEVPDEYQLNDGEENLIPDIEMTEQQLTEVKPTEPKPPNVVTNAALGGIIDNSSRPLPKVRLS
jgi:hypothetical protein